MSTQHRLDTYKGYFRSQACAGNDTPGPRDDSRCFLNYRCTTQPTDLAQDSRTFYREGPEFRSVISRFQSW